jgi:hypothetical protein
MIYTLLIFQDKEGPLTILNRVESPGLEERLPKIIVSRVSKEA